MSSAEEFILHCKEGELSEVKRHLTEGCDANSRVCIGDVHTTPLIMAALGNRCDVATLLLSHGAVQGAGSGGVTPLSVAAKHGFLAMIELLLSHGATFETNERGESPLYVASSHGHDEAAAALLRGGATHAPANNGETPLLVASRAGHDRVVHVLLDGGATHDAAAEGVTPLFAACDAGHAKVVRMLLESGAELDVEVQGVITALAVACARGHTEVVKLLISFGAHKGPNRLGVTPLHVASEGGHVEIVRALLESGADQLVAPDGRTPLHFATSQGRAEVVEVLLAHGASQTANNEGETPLAIAAERGLVSMVSTLLRHLPHDIDALDFRALLVASYEGHGEVVRQIVQHFPDCTSHKAAIAAVHVASAHGHLLVLDALLEASVPQLAGDDGCTPLLLACNGGHVDVVSKLLAHGATHHPNAVGATPLLCASQLGHVDVVRVLLKNGATHQTAAGITPLFVASENGHAAVARELLNAGASHDTMPDGTSPLLIACARKHVDTVRVLLEHGANQLPRSDGMTPLLVASELKGSEELVRLLLVHGASHHANAVSGATPLFVASELGNSEVVKELLEKGATHERNLQGASPLLAASLSGHEDVVRILLAHGAEPNVAMVDGVTPLYAASQIGHPGIVELLLRHGASHVPAKSGATPVFIASTKGHAGIVELLLNSGADGTIGVSVTKTPLYQAAAHGHAAVVRVLLDRYGRLGPREGDQADSIAEVVGNSVGQIGFRCAIEALCAAAAKGYTEVVEELLTCCTPNGISSTGETPLLYACSSGSEDVVDVLLRHGATPDARDDGVSPLFLAAQLGFSRIVSTLLRHGASHDKTDDGATPLFIACQNGHEDVVEELLDHGVSDEPLPSGFTALHVASQNGHLQVVKLLIRSGAQHCRDVEGVTPLFAAAENGHAHVVKELLVGGARSDPTDQGVTARYIASQNGHLDVVKELDNAKCGYESAHTGVDKRELDESSPLFIAAQNGRADIVAELLDQGHTPAPRADGSTPLFIASLQGHADVVRLLLQNGATHSPNRSGETPLNAAAQEGHVETVGVLLSGGATQEPNRDGATPMHRACAGGHLEVVALLLEQGAESFGSALYSPMVHAVREGHHDIVRLLLAHCVQAPWLSHGGDVSPLAAAAHAGDVDMFRELARHFPEDVCGDVLLHAAAQGEHDGAVIKVCVKEFNCDVDARDSYGFTPLHHALLFGRRPAVEVLLEIGASLQPLLSVPLPEDAVYQPPRGVLLEGVDRLRSFVAGSTHEARQVLKLILIGPANGGKTSLIRSLRGANAVRGYPATGGVEIASLELSDVPNEMRVVSFDFAGTLRCLEVHKSFLARSNVLYVVVVDGSQRRSIIRSDMEHWSRYLRENLPAGGVFPDHSIHVQVVCSHVDLLLSSAERHSCREDVVRWQREFFDGEFRASPPLLLSSTQSSSGDGLDELVSIITGCARDVASRPALRFVPQSCVDVDDGIARALQSDGAVPWVFPVVELAQWSGVSDVGELEAEYLQRVGRASLSPSGTFICIEPARLSHILAVFLSRECGSRDVLLLHHQAAQRLVEGALQEVAERCSQELRISTESVIEVLLEWPVWCRASVHNKDVLDRWSMTCPDDSGADVLMLLSSRGKAASFSPVPPWKGAAEMVVRRAVPQRVFDRAQAGLADFWDIEHDVLVNAFAVRDNEEQCFASIVRYEDGMVEVSSCGGERRSANALMERVCAAFGASGEHDGGPWDRVGDADAAFAVCEQKLLKVLPWSWVGGREFELAESHRWKRLDAAKAKALGLDPSIIQKHVYWSYLNNAQLRVLNPELSEDQCARMCAPDRCKQLTSKERECLRAAGLPSGLGNAEIHDLQYTELVAGEETHHARVAELERVKKWFEHFLGVDGTEEMELVRVVALRNPALEFASYACLEEMQSRLGDGHDSWGNRQEIMRNAVETEDGDRRELLQRHTLDTFSNYFLRDAGTDPVNVVLGWQGSEERWLYSNASCGVRRIPPLQSHEEDELRAGNPSRFDYGYCGKGVYFSQFPSYGKVYSRMVMEDVTLKPLINVEASATTSASDEDEGEITFPLMLSFLLLGSPYPVTEKSSLPWGQSLHGRPCVEGFDSHYALMGGARADMEPIGVDEEGCIEPVQADEIVVFGPPQVLPRYIVYCAPRSTLADPLEECSIVVWIMSLGQHEELRTVEEAAALQEGVQLLRAERTASLVSWLGRNKYSLLGHVRKGRLRIVTSRSRELDGGDAASDLLLRRVRTRAEWSDVDVLVYDPAIQEAGQWNPAEHVLVTSSASMVASYSLFQDDVPARQILCDTAQQVMQVVGAADGGTPEFFTSRADEQPAAAQRAVLWVTPNYTESVEVVECASVLARNCEQRVKLFLCSQTLQAFAWLEVHGGGYKEIRVISNRCRAGDGEDSAASHLVEFLRRSERWSKLPILLFSSRIGPIIDLWSGVPSAFVMITTSTDGVCEFASRETIEPPRYASMLMVRNSMLSGSSQNMLPSLTHTHDCVDLVIAQKTLRDDDKLCRMWSTAHWRPDESSTMCQFSGCDVEFVSGLRWGRRRHHCRYCGRVLCRDHAPKRAALDNKRLCVDCLSEHI